MSQANNGSDNTESSQDVSDYDEDAVTGSFTVIDTNTSNEHSKREIERTYNKVSYYFLAFVFCLFW